jgi:hypothetical protein
MIHWECDARADCPIMEVIRISQRIDRPISAELARGCDQCWRTRNHLLPLAPTTSPDLAEYTDDIDARPAFLEIMAIERKRLLGEWAA